MKLAVSILNYRTADLTLKSIQATIDSLVDFRHDWQIFVVDNDSQDGSEESLRAAHSENQAKPGWDKVEIHQSGRNGGFGAGNNFAIKCAQAKYPDLEYIYILNSDAFPDKGAIDLLVDYLDNNPKYGFSGSFLYGTDGVPHESCFRFPSLLGELEGSIRFGPVSKLLKNYQVPLAVPKASCDVDWLAGASMLARTKTLDEVGCFDETFFLYFEETDLSLRAHRKGWLTRYILESKVVHVGSASTGMKKWERIPSYWLDSRKYYFSKNHGSFYFFTTTLLRVFGELFYSTRCVIERKENANPKRFIRDMIGHVFS